MHLWNSYCTSHFLTAFQLHPHLLQKQYLCINLPEYMYYIRCRFPPHSNGYPHFLTESFTFKLFVHTKKAGAKLRAKRWLIWAIHNLMSSLVGVLPWLACYCLEWAWQVSWNLSWFLLVQWLEHIQWTFTVMIPWNDNEGTLNPNGYIHGSEVIGDKFGLSYNEHLLSEKIDFCYTQFFSKYKYWITCIVNVVFLITKAVPILNNKTLISLKYHICCI